MATPTPMQLRSIDRIIVNVDAEPMTMLYMGIADRFGQLDPAAKMQLAALQLQTNMGADPRLDEDVREALLLGGIQGEVVLRLGDWSTGNRLSGKVNELTDTEDYEAVVITASQFTFQGVAAQLLALDWEQIRALLQKRLDNTVAMLEASGFDLSGVDLSEAVDRYESAYDQSMSKLIEALDERGITVEEVQEILEAELRGEVPSDEAVGLIGSDAAAELDKLFELEYEDDESSIVFDDDDEARYDDA